MRSTGRQVWRSTNRLPASRACSRRRSMKAVVAGGRLGQRRDVGKRGPQGDHPDGHRDRQAAREQGHPEAAAAAAAVGGSARLWHGDRPPARSAAQQAGQQQHTQKGAHGHPPGVRQADVQAAPDGQLKCRVSPAAAPPTAPRAAATRMPPIGNSRRSSSPPATSSGRPSFRLKLMQCHQCRANADGVPGGMLVRPGASTVANSPSRISMAVTASVVRPARAVSGSTSPRRGRVAVSSIASRPDRPGHGHARHPGHGQGPQIRPQARRPAGTRPARPG